MKSHFKILSFVFALSVFSNTLSAQSNNEKKANIPSDVNAGFTYDFDKTQELIIDRITNPTPKNADVQVLLNQTDFPIAPNNKTIDVNYKDQLRKWMEKNPNIIITTLKSRKDIVTQY